jgi:hypothetical protein
LLPDEWARAQRDAVEAMSMEIADQVAALSKNRAGKHYARSSYRKMA